MDWDRVIYNGTVVNDDGMQRADIYIRDGRVAAVTSERLPGTIGETTDASGRYILPGLIETHVHSRDGRLATGEKEDFPPRRLPPPVLPPCSKCPTAPLPFTRRSLSAILSRSSSPRPMRISAFGAWLWAMPILPACLL